MKEVKFKDLKKGDKIILNNEQHIIENIEFSKIGKHGKSKCRIEAKNTKTNETKVIIRLNEDTIETP